MAPPTKERVLPKGDGKKRTIADMVCGGRSLPSRLIVHAHGGMGKTSFAAHAPKPFFLCSPGETGIQTLCDAGQVPADVPNLEIFDWQNLLDILDEFATTEHGYQTLVLDVIDGFEKLCNAHVCKESYKNDWSSKSFGDYSAGNRQVANDPWRRLLIALDAVRENGVRPILLAHTTEAKYENPAGSDYQRYIPAMYKEVWGLTYGWADICLFAHTDASTYKEGVGERAKSKGAGGRNRSFQATWTASADAKNRHGLPEEIPMGESGAEAWDNFVAAVQAGRAKAE